MNCCLLDETVYIGRALNAGSETVDNASFVFPKESTFGGIC